MARGRCVSFNCFPGKAGGFPTEEISQPPCSRTAKTKAKLQLFFRWDGTLTFFLLPANRMSERKRCCDFDYVVVGSGFGRARFKESPLQGGRLFQVGSRGPSIFKNHICRLLRDHDYRRVSVAADDCGHNRRVRNP